MQNALGGFSNVSIESLLEKHIKMMDPISWSDLSLQKMNNNSYQLPFVNMKIKDKIGGARVFIANKPQPTRRLERNNTEKNKEDQLENDYKCAMNAAGVSGDPLLANGFVGAGYTSRVGDTTQTISNSQTVL